MNGVYNTNYVPAEFHDSWPQMFLWVYFEHFLHDPGGGTQMFFW